LSSGKSQLHAVEDPVLGSAWFSASSIALPMSALPAAGGTADLALDPNIGSLPAALASRLVAGELHLTERRDDGIVCCGPSAESSSPANATSSSFHRSTLGRQRSTDRSPCSGPLRAPRRQQTTAATRLHRMLHEPGQVNRSGHINQDAEIVRCLTAPAHCRASSLREELTRIDDPLYIEERRYERGDLMLRLLRKTRQTTVEFCERCAEVCTSACRADALRAQAREKAFLHLGRVW
jgi:hypothetical protein